MEQTYVKIERENQISGWVTTVRVERDKCPGEAKEKSGWGEICPGLDNCSGGWQVSKRC